MIDVSDDADVSVVLRRDFDDLSAGIGSWFCGLFSCGCGGWGCAVGDHESMVSSVA